MPELDPMLVIDAIDELMDGFTLFDADDKIVFCNMRQKEMFPGMADLLVPGASFESLLRTNVGKGTIATAAGREEEWIAERIAIHRDSDGTAYEYETADGRWIKTREVRLKNGCRVGLRTDITERKLAEAALRRSEERFRSYSELGLIGMALTSPDKGWVHVNDKLCEIFGYPEDELVNLTWAEITHPDDLDADVAQFNRVLAGEIDDYTMDKRFIRKDGEIVFTSISAKCLRKEDGNVDHFVAFVQDITERKQAEESAKRSEDALVISEAAANSGHWVWYSDTQEVIWSKQCYEIFGRNPETWVPTGENFRDDMPQEDRTLLEAANARGFETGEPFSIEYRYYRGGSREEIRWVLASCNFLRNENGGFSEMTGIVQDITERKLAEEALKESEAKFHDYAEVAADWFWEQDADLRFTNVTEDNTPITGMEPADHYGKTRRETGPLDVSEEAMAAHEAQLLAREPFADFRFARIGPDGGKIHISISGKPIFDGDGNFLGYRGAGRDITEFTAMAAQLVQSQKMEAVGQLTGGIAHDFNNILGIIMGNLQLLQRKAGDNPEVMKFARQALKGTERGADITKKLLSFSHQAPRNTEQVAANNLVAGMEDLIAKSLTAAVEVETVLASELWPAEINPGDLQDAVLNLCLNARDAMPDGGKLVIETANKVLDNNFVRLHPTAKAGEFVVISVTDNGTGMSAEVKEKLFEPFFTTKTFGKGSGLGLSMVHGFVERSGGNIQVYSEVGTGTTFHIFLPRAGEETKETETGSDHPANLPGGEETILIVDDEEVLRKVATAFLNGLGYKTLTAGNGEEALQVLKQHPGIDLLFCDVIMPGELDGYQVALEARKLHASAKVLLTSGFARMHEEHSKSDDKYLSSLASHLLGKPYNDGELALAVRRALDDGQA